MIEYSNGDLLKTDVDVIIHQTNCQGVMGAGIALQIKNMYPEVYTDYVNFCDTVNDTKKLLGECLISETNSGKYVANIFGQDRFLPRGIRHTDYSAFEGALKFLKTWMLANNIKTCGCPDHIGCALAGGDWDGVIHPMLKDIFENDNNIILKIVKFSS